MGAERVVGVLIVARLEGAMIGNKEMEGKNKKLGVLFDGRMLRSRQLLNAEAQEIVFDVEKEGVEWRTGGAWWYWSM